MIIFSMLTGFKKPFAGGEQEGDGYGLKLNFIQR
jgi:hypothetical protein